MPALGSEEEWLGSDKRKSLLIVLTQISIICVGQLQDDDGPSAQYNPTVKTRVIF